MGIKTTNARCVTTTVLTFLLVCIFTSFFRANLSRQRTVHTMSLTHTVLFQFKADVKAEDAKAVRASRAPAPTPTSLC